MKILVPANICNNKYANVRESSITFNRGQNRRYSVDLYYRQASFFKQIRNILRSCSTYRFLLYRHFFRNFIFIQNRNWVKKYKIE